MPVPTLEQIDRMFKAFSEPTRLRILHLIKDRRTCVGDLETILQMPQAHVSRHLLYLRNAGLVTCRKQSRWCFYALAEPEHSFHAKLLELLNDCFRHVPEIKADAKRARSLIREGGCCPTECEE
jgi:ArsR family transcriptional regulator